MPLPTPGSGAAAVFGWRRERAFNVPGTDDYTYLRPIPPLSPMLLRTENRTPEINPFGFREVGVPGPITGPIDIGAALTASTCLEPLENIFRDVEKTTLETGVYKYVFTPSRVLAETSLDAIFAVPPVHRSLVNGIKLSQLAMTMAGNLLIPSRMGGFCSHGTRLGAAVPDPGNTGVYYLDNPRLRGPLRDFREGEEVHIKITQTVGGGGLQYKAERVPDGGAAPTFLTAAQDVAYDGDDNGDWSPVIGSYQLTGTVTVGAGSPNIAGVGTFFTRELVAGKYLRIGAENRQILSVTDDDTAVLATNHTAGAAGVRAYILNEDFGIWDGNFDPLEVIYPGSVTDHGDIALNDIHVFPTDWDDPTADFLTGQRFTSAHLLVDTRPLNAGANAWEKLNCLTFNPTVASVLTPDQGNGSRYYQALDREAEFAPTIAVTRKWRDERMQDLKEAHKRVEMRARLLGKKLGTGDNRESVVFEMPSVGMTSLSGPVSGPVAVVETMAFDVEADADGDPAMTVTVITDRNWTPAT